MSLAAGSVLYCSTETYQDHIDAHVAYLKEKLSMADSNNIGYSGFATGYAVPKPTTFELKKLESGYVVTINYKMHAFETLGAALAFLKKEAK